MNELLVKIRNLLSANGGKMLYPDLLAEMDYQERGFLPRTLKLAKQNGVLKSNMIWDRDAKQNLHWIELVS